MTQVLKGTCEFLVITCRKDKSGWNKIKIEISAHFVLLCQRISLSLQISPVSFHIFHHQVLPRQFVVIRKVIDYLEIVHPVAYL